MMGSPLARPQRRTPPQPSTTRTATGARRQMTATASIRVHAPVRWRADAQDRPPQARSRMLASALTGILLVLMSSSELAAQQADTIPDAGAAENAIQYCENIASAAADARFTRQAAALAEMDKQIQARIDQLEAKRAEYQQWLQKREDFLKKADETVISMFSQMRPDAAAAQLAVMSDDVATAILSKVNPRVSSAILNEMDPARAARLTGIMVGIAKRTQS